ncbi:MULTISPECIES: hypothetical protein [Tsukamurella]|uniref:Uncharacterized protein n=2 Tax=Tsukamurella TaxID=2060 RepID=A0A1H1ASB5_9ACTN|nr:MULTISPECIES: hypothetical protein [Tsukamurella]KXO92878.1 hypothetical protein AXK56_22495 [Tsukamurella pulmonis]KXP14159.1 hypothetical protein AXK60_22025 [Tsukamurella pseudospumae]SDQ42482.1 hypothetical protein SAMN04489765_0362 [Tsukamurella pulmonis]SUP26184.1 Uncharacterised protein [Tsukamurella pulmonis]
MATSDEAAQFVSGNDRLAQILSDPERRTRVDAITSEMALIDRQYRAAVQLLDGALAATSSIAGPAVTAEVLDELHRHLTAAGAQGIGITLTFAGHEMTVPLERRSANTER